MESKNKSKEIYIKNHTCNDLMIQLKMKILILIIC